MTWGLYPLVNMTRSLFIYFFSGAATCVFMNSALVKFILSPLVQTLESHGRLGSTASPVVSEFWNMVICRCCLQSLYFLQFHPKLEALGHLPL